MRTQKFILLTLVAFVFTACTSNSQKTNNTEVEKLTDADALVQSIEKAHHKESFLNKKVVQFDLNLAFGGKSRFNGTISMTPNGDFAKMKDSSETVIWNGKDVFISPDTANAKGVRFAVLTWSYFFAAPYKLSDPGTKHEFLGEKKLGDNTFEANKLTFGENVGDSPDDWYIVYKEQEEGLLAAMAYIVTLGKDLEKAEADPHAITYEAYVTIDGIPFATQWNFWTWNDAGELNKLLGEASISNIQFKEEVGETFKIPEASKRVEKPEA